MTRIDEQIKKEVVDQLYWDTRIDASDVKVEVTNGVVTLSGTVPDYMGFRAAGNDVWDIPGVLRVDNRLIVRYPAEVSIPGKEEMVGLIENMIRWNANLDETKITVTSEDGRIKLEGSVDSYWKKSRAEEIVHDVVGVVEVVNELAVVPTDDILDEAIGEELMGALERNIYVDPNAINVKVEKGRITLSGSVENSLTLRAVVDTARHTPGVTDVVNNLALR
jgi:osmotically-inducible protein OsmY